ncbi:MAG: MFS transporter, partial [Sulfobacillus sp.]
NNIMQRVAGSFGLAALTALLQEQATMHAQTLASAYTPASGSAMQLFQGLQGLIAKEGIPGAQAVQLTITTLYGMIEQQAFVMGIDDVFVVAALFTVVGAILALGLKTYRTQGTSARPMAAD